MKRRTFFFRSSPSLFSLSTSTVNCVVEVGVYAKLARGDRPPYIPNDQRSAGLMSLGSDRDLAVGVSFSSTQARVWTALSVFISRIYIYIRKKVDGQARGGLDVLYYFIIK